MDIQQEVRVRFQTRRATIRILLRAAIRGNLLRLRKSRPRPFPRPRWNWLQPLVAALPSCAFAPSLFVAGVALLSILPPAYAQSAADAFVTNSPASIWKTRPGEGFRSGATELNVSAGIGLGVKMITGVGIHDWVIGTVDYGWVFSDVVAESHWWRGNWELLGDLFGGMQYRPEGAYFVGIGPHLRYNFAAGHRWTPFVDLGGGVSATDIREPDLSTTFEFNLQAGVGTHYYLCDDLALTFQTRLIHLSNAGLKYPNTGVNNVSFLLGVSWFF